MKPRDFSAEPNTHQPKHTSTGLVNHILPQSFVDGPGNRTVVFLQGCNFHCTYCHNPFTINLCNSCGMCVPGCPAGALKIQNGIVLWDGSICAGCDNCIKTCPCFSSPKAKRYSPGELWEGIRHVVAFISGVSVSGGEPSLQVDFLVEFFKLVKSSSSLTTLIETNGFAGETVYEPLFPWLDMVLMDLKISDPVKHKELTGQDNARVLSNLEYFYRRKKLECVNQVIVPGVHTEDDIMQSAQFLASLDATIPLKFLRFRPHGTVGDARTWESPSDETMEHYVRIARQQGLLNVSRSL